MKRNRECKILPSDGGFTAIGHTSREDANAMVKRGTAWIDRDPVTHEIRGYRKIRIEHRRMDADVASIRSSAAISKNEMLQNAGRSRTRFLNEEERLDRIKNGFAPEDATERVQAKVRVYPHVGAAKGDILRAWPR